MTSIYVLERNGVPFYIGKTIQTLKNRYYTHGDKKNSEIYELDIVEDNKWRFWESWYIELYKSWGFILENKNNGGGGRGPGWISSIERNNKIKMALKNHSKYYTKEVRQKISDANKNIPRPFSKEHKQNMLIAKRKQAKSLLMFSLENKLIKEWESKGQAAEWIKEQTGKTSNITTQIKDCCLGRQKTAFKFKWKYK
jgi:hypothetical protein